MSVGSDDHVQVGHVLTWSLWRDCIASTPRRTSATCSACYLLAERSCPCVYPRDRLKNRERIDTTEFERDLRVITVPLPRRS